MNPPSALHGAMSRDRKPFTYTPGGLDLSEIKSSRMAARLMRNAMNEGVPELPKHTQPSPVSSTPIAVPNFNCLPVQVFPTFNLPANPKSLLRTRSNPGQPRDLLIQKARLVQPQSSQLVNNYGAPVTSQYDKNNLPYSQSNNRPVSMFEYGSPVNTFTQRSYDNDSNTQEVPKISYDAEYLRMPSRVIDNTMNTISPVETIQSVNNVDITKNILSEKNNIVSNASFQHRLFEDSKEESKSMNAFNENSIYQDYLDNAFKPDIEKNNVSSYEPYKPYGSVNNTFLSDIENNQTVEPVSENNYYQTILGADSAFVNDNKEDNYNNTTQFSEIVMNENNIYNNNKLEIENTKQLFESENKKAVVDNTFKTESESGDITLRTFDKPTTDYLTFTSENAISKPVDEISCQENQKKEVKIVKKQVITKESNVKEQNGSNEQNGDNDVEAVIKLPAKKSEGKTETKVEVTKKTLPDGSIEEVKKTITKTTIDGRTEIKTKTETTIIPKEDDEEEIEEEEEEVEENDDEVAQEKIEVVEETENKVNSVKLTDDIRQSEENGQANIIKTEERSETSTTTSKKVVVIQDDQNEELAQKDEVIEENESIEEEEPVTFVMKQPAATTEPLKSEETNETQEKEEEEDVEEEEIENEVVKEQNTDTESKIEAEKQETQTTSIAKEDDEEEEVEEEEEYEEAEEKEISETKPVVETKSENDENVEKTQHEPSNNDEKDEVLTEATTTSDEVKAPKTENLEDNKLEQVQEITEEKQEVKVEKEEIKGEKQDVSEETLTSKEDKSETFNQKVPLREPSVPLEKVEDVEIKPIGLGEFLTKTHTENTEIITNITEKPTGLLTEINRIENIVTINRTTKTLDHAYENITQQGIPTVKTYFTPHIDKISTSPLPSRPYQPVYPPEPTTERRHSLLLERLSVERQMPSDIYQNNYQHTNQTIEQQRQWSQEPQAEVLTVSNVKPSQITNQQWYQQKENAIYNNVAPSPQPTQQPAPTWTQAKPQQQPSYQPQSQYQPPPQPQYQSTPQTHPQPQYQAQFQPPPTQPQYQPSYTENIQESTSSSYQNNYSTYTPKPTNWTSNSKPLSPIPTIITPNQSNQYSYLNNDSSDSYQKTTQHFSSSSYVPPPWEQDSNYVAPNTSQNYYQPSPQTNAFSPTPTQDWKPNLPSSKFNKTPPKAYIPPKPNQSFVKPVIVEPPKMPGRKTYYSEYERRYISVPESTYIPGENKYQPQPDPSPAYYYDNNEPTETVEPQWRRELREFTEKSQSQTTTETNVKPPWESETKYAKAPEQSYTPTPTWSQTVRPQSWRERSFESEFVSQEWPKTNTLGRGRPLSSYGKETVPERTRGVSVDRYNPNSYQAPVAAEHPPVQTHTHVPPAPHATGYHNQNVPAYHARASAEPREQVYYQQPRNYKEARASPFQSRSFKYLQWITGTED